MSAGSKVQQVPHVCKTYRWKVNIFCTTIHIALPKPVESFVCETNYFLTNGIKQKHPNSFLFVIIFTHFKNGFVCHITYISQTWFIHIQHLHYCFLCVSKWQQIHTCSISKRFNCKTHGFCTFSRFGPNIWNNLPQDSRHSATLFLQKPTGDIALLQIFQLNNTTLHSHQSAQCVCVCGGGGGGGGGGIMQIVHIVMSEPLLMYTLCISCLSNCRWQSLSQSTLCAFVEHFEPQGRHFTNIHDYYYKKEKKKALFAQFKTWLCPICVSQNKQCPFQIACTGRWNIHKPKPKCTKKTIHQQLSNTTAKLRLLVINEKSQIMRTAPHPHDPAKRSYNTVLPQQSTNDLQAVRSVHITRCRSDNCCSRRRFWTGKYLAVNRRHSLQTCIFIQTPLKLNVLNGCWF